MELIIKKNQADKMLGGVKFEINIKVNLTTEEKEIIDKYKAGKMILHQRREKSFNEAASKAQGGIVKILGANILDKIFNNITIASLIEGISFKCDNISQLLDHEIQIKEVCRGFYEYLQTMKNFGGEEKIQIDELSNEQ